MTREEAIICLQGLLDNPLINKGSYLAQAIEMAIKALEQEPCKVSEYDKDHIWYKGRQYISLRRFLEVKAEAEQNPTEDYEYEIERLQKWLDIAEYDKERLKEKIKALEQKPILDKIRAEIEAEITHNLSDDQTQAFAYILQIIDNAEKDNCKHNCKECEHNDGECCRILFERSFEQEPTSVKHDTFPVKLQINKVYKHISNIDLDELDQEPCDDVVSRQAVLDLAEKGILVSNGNYKSVCKAINELPPVIPQERGEQW